MDTDTEVNFSDRKSPRADFHNYSGGDYFVTICTRNKEYYFGKIRNGEMQFTELGEFANAQLASLSSYYGYIEVPLFVVMPNHIHAIIRIIDSSDLMPRKRTALSVVIGGFKQSVSVYARRNNIEFGWQPRYHDHIIRGTHDGNKIAEYILNNVARWSADCFYI